MSAVSNVITTNTAPAGYTAEGIVGNLSKVLNEIYPKKADNMVANGMITEEQLFAAFAFGEISQKKPQLAQNILSDLREQFQALKNGGDIRPLYHAMEKAINKAVARGKLTSQEGSQIIRTSLGMAQLDNKNNFLSARKIKFNDQGTVAAGTTYMDRVLSKISDNTAFSAEGVTVAENRMAALDAKGVTYAPEKKAAISVVFNGGLDGGVVETTVPVSNGSDVIIEANRFGYWPVSHGDNVMKIQIPRDLANGAVKVEIRNRNTDELLEGAEFNIQTSEGAKRAKFTKKGTEYGDGFRVRIYWADGRSYEREIQDSSKVVRTFISN
jgi:polyhydroxyalkanoate synthesis regulator phasin